LQINLGRLSRRVGQIPAAENPYWNDHCPNVPASKLRLHFDRTHAPLLIAYTALDEIKVHRRAVVCQFDGYFQKARSPIHLVALIHSSTS